MKPVFILFLTIFIDLLGFGLVIPILPIFARELQATAFQIGLIAGVYSLMNFLFAPFWGTLSDKIGRRPVMLMSITITMLSYFFFAFTHDLIFLVISRIAAGIGSANISAAQAYISDISTPEDRAKKMGLIGAAFGLGFIFGPPLGGWLKAMSGIGSVDVLGFAASGLCALNLLLAFFLLPESIKQKQTHKKFEFKPVRLLITELGKPHIRELFWVNFMFIMAFSMMQVSCAMLWSEHYGLNEKQVGFVFMFMGLSSAIVQGGLVGRLNKAWGELRMMVTGTISMFAGLAAMPFIPQEMFWLQLVCIIFISFANGCITPAVSSLISKSTSPSEQGKILGTNLSFGSLARVAGPAAGGVLYQMNFILPFLGGGLVMLLAYGVSRLIRVQA